MQPDASRTPALAHEGVRNLVSLGIAAAVAVIAVLGYNAFARVRFTVDAVALTVFVFWIGYSLAFLILTQIPFGRADSRTLRSWPAATNLRSQPGIPTSAAQWAVLP